MARLVHSLRSIVSSPKKPKEDGAEEPPHLDINRRISLKRLFTHLPILHSSSSLHSQSSSFDLPSSHKQQQLQPQPQDQLEHQPTPPRPDLALQNNSPPPPHHTPFHLITSKLRRQPSSSAALPAEPPTPDAGPDHTPSSFSLKSFRNVRAPLLAGDSTPSPKPEQQPLQQAFSQSSLSLPIANPNPTPTPTPTPSRPPSVTTISRPSSPSSKISAAAFREARAARNSRSITPSSFPEPLSRRPKLQSSASTASKYIKHTRFKSSPHTHLTSNPTTTTRPASLHANSNSSTRNPLTLADLHPTGHRYQSSDSIDPSTRLGPNPNPSASGAAGLYNDNEVLVPPRPPFYGSRLAARSVSSDPRSSLYYPPPSHHPDTSLKNRRPSTIVDTRSLYTHPFINQSSTSVRSVPSTLIPPPTPSAAYARRRSATTAKPQQPNSDQLQLEQWHSDEEDEHSKSSTPLHPPRRPIPQSHNNPTKLPPQQSRPRANKSDDVKSLNTKPVDDDDDEDEVPLSKLKKKSFSSLRGTAAAQTLARERQQLHSISTNVRHTSSGFLQSPSPLGGSHATLPNHTRHVSTSFLPTQRDPSVNAHRHSKFISGHPVPSTTAHPKPDGHPPMRTLLHPRGNSPASSSSGSGSGSGTWSIPITPRNSTGNLNLLLPPLPPSAGHQHAHFLSNFHRDVHNSRFNATSPKSSTLDQLHSDVESIVSCGNPSKTPTTCRPVVSSESPKSLLHQEQGVWNHRGVAVVEDLSMPPAGVDHFLYSTLSIEQKMELHHQSELVKQMMAAQAKAAVQMHAMALSTAGGGRRKTILDEGAGPILEYDPTRMMYNWGSHMDPAAFQPVPAVVNPAPVPPPAANPSDDRRR